MTKHPTAREFKEALAQLNIPIKKFMLLDGVAEMLLFSATEEEVERFLLQKMDALSNEEKSCFIGLLLAHGRAAFMNGTEA